MSFRLIVHRGRNGGAPENSLAGIGELAGLPGVWAEVDVAVTADGVLVLHHDVTLARLAGLDSPVFALDYAEICRFYPIDRLDDALAAFPGQRFLLDVRHDVHDEAWQAANGGDGSALLRRIVAGLAALLTPDMRGRIAICMMTPAGRRLVEQALPGFEVMYAERFLRAAAERFRESGVLEFPAGIPDRALICTPWLSARLARQLQALGTEVISTFGGEEPAAQVLTALELGLAGAVVRPPVSAPLAALCAAA